MSPIVYIETNPIIAAVMGQDPCVDDLLSTPAEVLRLAVPTVCLMEAITAFDRKRNERNGLKGALDGQLSQVGRSLEIGAALRLTELLTHARAMNDDLLTELHRRLETYLLRVAGRAEMIDLVADDLGYALDLAELLRLGRADALILTCILAHARRSGDARKGFISGNVRDFAAMVRKDGA